LEQTPLAKDRQRKKKIEKSATKRINKRVSAKGKAIYAGSRSKKCRKEGWRIKNLL